MMRKLLLGAALLGLAGAANAVTYYSIAFDGPPGGNAGVGKPEKMIATFDDPIAAGYSFSGAHIVSGTDPALSLEPALNQTMYAAVSRQSTATLTTPGISTLSLYAGSIDTYNSITFHYADGTSETVGGAAFGKGSFGSGTNGKANRRVYFSFGDKVVSSVDFYSKYNSFEFDNIAASAAVPEPATWAMLIAGFGMVGFSARRRRSLSHVAN